MKRPITCLAIPSLVAFSVVLATATTARAEKTEVVITIAKKPAAEVPTKPPFFRHASRR